MLARQFRTRLFPAHTTRLPRCLASHYGLGAAYDRYSRSYMMPRRVYEPKALFDQQPPGTPPDQCLVDVNPSKSEFNKVLRDGQPDQIMNLLLDRRYEPLVASLPQSTFVEALHLLSPAYFIIPYRDIHRPLHPTAVRVKKYKPLELIFREFSDNLATIVEIRTSTGRTLGLAEYRHLLDCARSMGDRAMAERVWSELKQNPMVSPDLQCYNYYMEALVWDHAYLGLEKYRLRMTPFAYHRRSHTFTSPWGYQGFATRVRSVNFQVRDIFRSMTEAGVIADEESYVNVLLSAARVGNTNGVKNVLLAVWNVDVDFLCTDEFNPPQPLPLDRSSPVHPTDRLLFAVAHAFGTNSDIKAAVRSTDFISRSYGIPVPEHVWLELFERAFVLSRPRRDRLSDPETMIERNYPPKMVEHAFDSIAQSLGRIEPTNLFQLCDTMTASPYNLRPTIDMYRMLAKTAWNQRSLGEFLGILRSAYDLLKDTRHKRKEARLILEDYLARLMSPSGNIDTDLLQSRGFADAVKTYDLLRLQTAQNTIIIERLARLLLINRVWDSSADTRWERWHLPLALEEWQDFLPETFDFESTNGRVKFAGKSGWTQQYINLHKMTPTRRRTPSVGPDFEEETPELEDDFFWGTYRESSPLGQVDDHLLKRVFWEIRPGDEYVETEEEVMHQLFAPAEGHSEEQILNRELQVPVVPYRRRGKEHVAALYSKHHL